MPLDVSIIRALCFDVDGTLRDTDDQMVKRLARWFRPVSFFLPQGNPQDAARRIVMALENPGTYLHGLPDRLHVDHHVANLSNGLAGLRKVKAERQPPPLIPGVKEMLENLQTLYPMAVVSARGRRNTLAFLDYYQLSPLFKAIVTGQTCQHTKPFPDPILWAAEQMNVPPSSCLMVGDTTVDMLAGKAAGSQTVGVLCGFGEEEELLRSGADLILPSTPDIAKALLKSKDSSLN